MTKASRKTALIGDTPWGEAHTAETIGPGITKVTTAGHGGYMLDAEALAAMPATLRAIPTFAGPGFYEEDVDWAIVALSFPRYFSDLDLYQARGVLRSRFSMESWILSEEASTVWERVQAFVAKKGHMYYLGSCSTSGDTWSASFTRVSDGAQAQARDLTDEEIFSVQPVDLAKYGDRVKYEARRLMRSV